MKRGYLNLVINSVTWLKILEYKRVTEHDMKTRFTENLVLMMIMALICVWIVTRMVLGV